MALSVGLPFRGLQPFQSIDRDFFFGRTEEVYELYRLLDLSRFICIAGNSGTGKTSLVQAGLIPVLQSESNDLGGRAWRVIVLHHPGRRPLNELAQALYSLQPPDSAGLDRLLIALRSSSLGLTQALDTMPGLNDVRLVIVVEQFEEVFRVAFGDDVRPADEVVQFVQILLEACRSRSRSINVLATMRSDFIGECARFYRLDKAVADGLFLIPALTRQQREDAIRRPIETAHATIDPSLVERLLNDRGDIDDLPVFQHCMLRLWHRANERNSSSPHIEAVDYASIGGLRGALSCHAEEIMESLPPPLAIAAEYVFRAMTDVDALGRAVRRPLTLRRLKAETGLSHEDTVRVVDHFRAEECGFILPLLSLVPVLSDDDVLDITHEAIIRNWDRLSGRATMSADRYGWVAEEDADGRLYRALLALAREGRTIPPDQLRERYAWWCSRPRTAAWADRYGGEIESVNRLFSECLPRLEADRRHPSREDALARNIRLAVTLCALLAGIGLAGAALSVQVLINSHR